MKDVGSIIVGFLILALIVASAMFVSLAWIPFIVLLILQIIGQGTYTGILIWIGVGYFISILLLICGAVFKEVIDQLEKDKIKSKF